MDIKKLDEAMKAEIQTIKDESERTIKQIKTKYAELKKQTSNEKPKRKTIPKSVKDKIWNLTFGREAGVGGCYCCQEQIDSKSFHAGHIVSVHHGGSNNIDNLKPICATCNLSMGTQNLEEFKKQYYDNDDSMEYEFIMENYNCNKCKKTIETCDEENYEIYRQNCFNIKCDLCEGYINRQCRY